ncbi:hypothetical protein ACKKBG_A30740 [Auxenochlorella protothecoides x Auxenochlorella symbiontica]
MRPSRSGHGLRIFLALGFLLHRSAHAEIGGFKGPDPEVLDFCNATEDDQAVRVEAESDFHGPLMIAEISNATIGYFRFGDQTTGRPPLLVFAPFGYTMGDMPRPAMRSLAAHQEVILFDHRGQGFSTDYSNDSPSIVSMANDAMELVEALHLSTKPNVLSFSLGSCVALAVAVLHGPSFASFVIASGSAGSPNSPPATAWAQSVLLDPEARPLEQLAIVYPLQYQSAAQAACDWYLNADPLAPDPYNFTTASRQAFALVEFFLSETRVWDGLPGVKNSLLLMGGEEDVVMPVDSQKLVAARAARAWSIVFKEAGHTAVLQFPEVAFAIMEQFLTFESSLG